MDTNCVKWLEAVCSKLISRSARPLSMGLSWALLTALCAVGLFIPGKVPGPLGSRQ